jgi:hypothetical protein
MGAAKRPKRLRRWRVSARVCLVLSILFCTSLIITCLYRWMAGDALEGQSRLDYGVHDGAVWIVYYQTEISWIAVKRGGEWDPEWPLLWPVVDRGGWDTFALPLWMPTALFAFAYVALRLMGTRRLKAGACPECGYDIGLENPKVCPECGHRVPGV